ncbi:MAG: DNA topoisomerase I [Chloroflexi bacterium]|nr:MAG: DNA topoisomerase I [Chloroflexota bacterium]
MYRRFHCPCTDRAPGTFLALVTAHHRNEDEGLAVEQFNTSEDSAPPLISDPVEAATAAGLRYFTDARPGIRRDRDGDGFAYVSTHGDGISDQKTLERISSLGIPPAWTEIWICPSPRGHIQATGRDAKRRKQYRYHPHWREVRDETKYTRLLAFGEALSMIRERTDGDLALHALSREKVLATVVELLDATAIRVGNEEYARENESFGLTTLRTDHVDIQGSMIRFHFRGKSGKEHEVDVRDKRLARAVKRCEEIPGHELFQYVNGEGERETIDSADVNDYLRHITGQNFTAKDFRTWHGTTTAASHLHALGTCESATQAKQNVVEAVKRAADHLGNTAAICRKSYEHPGIIEAYMNASLVPVWDLAIEQYDTERHPGLRPEEVATLAVLETTVEEMGEGNRAAS